MKRTDKESWESFIRNNKDDFNTKDPGDLWVGIEASLPAEKKNPKLIPIYQVYKYAALFIIALGFGYLAMYLHFTTPDPVSASKPIQVESQDQQEPEYVAELAEVEDYYAAEIDNKLNQLKEFEDQEEIIEELNLLQEEFEELKTEMGDQINDERIVQAMIQNYRLRLELLKEILEELHPDASKQKIRTYGNNI